MGTTAGLAGLALMPRRAFAADKEAPELAAMVADGKLPALADRVGSNPMVVTPAEKIGVPAPS